MSYHYQNPRYSPPPTSHGYDNSSNMLDHRDSTLPPPQPGYYGDNAYNNNYNYGSPSRGSSTLDSHFDNNEKVHMYDPANNRSITPDPHAAPAAAPLGGGGADNAPYYGFADEPVKRKRRYRFCGCCFSRCYWKFCIPITLVVLAGLAVAGYFLWPRIPKADFDRIDVASKQAQNSDSALEKVIGSIGFSRDGTMSLPLEIHLNVSNPNFIPWTINNVTVDGFINLASGKGKFPVGKGGLPEAFKMPKKSTENNMVIDFIFKLDINEVNYRDAAELVQKSCTANGPPLKFSYDAKVEVKPISSVGIKPKISDTVDFKCPLQGISDLGIDIKQLTGL